MIEFYLDSADVAEIARFHACLPIKGITTNPSILANAGIGVTSLLTQVSSILGEHPRFHVQVVSQTLPRQ